MSEESSYHARMHMGQATMGMLEVIDDEVVGLMETAGAALEDLAEALIEQGLELPVIAAWLGNVSLAAAFRVSREHE